MGMLRIAVLVRDDGAANEGGSIEPAMTTMRSNFIAFTKCFTHAIALMDCPRHCQQLYANDRHALMIFRAI